MYEREYLTNLSATYASAHKLRPVAELINTDWERIQEKEVINIKLKWNKNVRKK